MPVTKTLTVGGNTYDFAYKTSDLTNDSGFVDAAGAAAAAPVQSVNGQTGDVVTPTEQDIADAIIQVLPVDSASGAVASFPDGFPAPVEALSVQITPVQSGSGTPAPDNIRPITGWSEAVVTDDPAYGGDIYWNQLVVNGNFADGANGWEAVPNVTTISASGGEMTVTLTKNNPEWYQYRLVRDGSAPIDLIYHHKYFTMGMANPSVAGRFRITEGANNYKEIILTANTWNTLDSVFECNVDTVSNVWWVFYGTSLQSGTTIKYKNLALVDLTAMFGAGNEPATVDEFRALFPKDYYPYNAGETTCVSAVNGDPYRQITVDLSGTRYGGTLDVLTGVLTVTHGIIEATTAGSASTSSTGINYASININPAGQLTEKVNSCISDTYEYVTGVPYAGTNNIFRILNTTLYLYDNRFTNLATAQSILASEKPNFVYPLATPLSVQLTPSELETLLGQNNVWANCGDVAVSYRADIQRYIEKKLS